MKRKREERRKRRRLKFKTLFMLSLTLIFNTYAWFLYVTTVSTNMTVHVDAWAVNFEVDGTAVEKEFVLPVDHAYPGMEDVEKTISISNTGEKIADLSYSIAKARIINDVFVVMDELTTEEKAALTGTEVQLTKEQMITKLQTEYPFKIIVNCDKTQLDVDGNASVKMKLTWDYDNNDDDKDTQYGVDSYNYYQANPGSSAIEVVIKIKAQQHQG